MKQHPTPVITEPKPLHDNPLVAEVLVSAAALKTNIEERTKPKNADLGANIIMSIGNFFTKSAYSNESVKNQKAVNNGIIKVTSAIEKLVIDPKNQTKEHIDYYKGTLNILNEITSYAVKKNEVTETTSLASQYPEHRETPGWFKSTRQAPVTELNQLTEALQSELNFQIKFEN